MRLGVFYYSTSGNTEEMARAFADGAQDAGAEVELAPVAEVSAEQLASCDAFALGSPAQGSEEMDDTEFLPFYEEHKEAMAGHPVFLFGSYGWGGGQYMEDFADQAKSDGLEVKEVHTQLEAPDEDCLELIKTKAQAFVS